MHTTTLLIPHENLMQDLLDQKGTFNVIYGPPDMVKPSICGNLQNVSFTTNEQTTDQYFRFSSAANLQDGLENRTSDYRLDLGDIVDDDGGQIVSYKNQAEYTMILAHAVEESVVGLDQEFIGQSSRTHKRGWNK